MRTKRLAAVVSGGLLTAAVIAGCGDSSDSDEGGDTSSAGDYCGMIEDVQGEFGGLESGDATLADLGSMSDRMGDIADAAPSEVSSEWSSMHSAIDKMVTSLEDAGVATDKPLEEAVTAVLKEDKSKREELLSSMSGLGEVQSDAEKVQKNVKEECGIELGEEESSE